MSGFRHGVFALLAALALGGTAHATALVSPFDVDARRALLGRALPEAACPSPPAPVRDIQARSYYSDARHSIVDPAAHAAHDAAVKPLHDFADGVTRQADRWMGSHPPRPEAAACALAWLNAWAIRDAMLGRVTNQGGYERKWTLGGIALAYLKIHDAPGLDPATKTRVESWLRRLSEAVRPYYDAPPGSGSGRINNHLYWAALAVAASAVASDDRTAFDWAIAKYRFALTQIGKDGTLPLELMRGRRALHYHLFAVAPLVMLAEIGTANGLDLYAENNGALTRLVGRVVNGLNDPESFAKRTGEAQEPEGLRGNNIAWAEIWYQRTRDPAVLPLLRSHRPARNIWLGGDMTGSFGIVDLPGP
jgi:poly(beta-D-mannuronate) lyase